MWWRILLHVLQSECHFSTCLWCLLISSGCIGTANSSILSIGTRAIARFVPFFCSIWYSCWHIEIEGCYYSDYEELVSRDDCKVRTSQISLRDSLQTTTSLLMLILFLQKDGGTWHSLARNKEECTKGRGCAMSTSVHILLPMDNGSRVLSHHICTDIDLIARCVWTIQKTVGIVDGAPTHTINGVQEDGCQRHTRP